MAELGEKSGMTGSCERNAGGSTRLEANAIHSFIAVQSRATASRPVRQGVSSTDKDVIAGHAMLKMMRESSCSLHPIGLATEGVWGLSFDDFTPQACAGSLVDGRYRLGLDSGVVSLKLPQEIKACASTAKQLMRVGFRRDLEQRDRHPLVVSA